MELWETVKANDTGHPNEPSRTLADRQGGFTRGTMRLHTAIRMIAYSLATLFMIVMVWRGVWLTTAQMEAEADRAIRFAVSAIEARKLDRGATEALLELNAPAGLILSLENAAAKAAAGTTPGSEVRRIALTNGTGTLVAKIDHDAIARAAWDANRGYVLFVLALGLPVIAIFLYMGWAVNRPALELLAFAQAGPEERRPAPDLPAIWNSVLARLKQLKDSQTQMQAFLDHAPIGMMFRDARGKLAMINRYGASFYDLSAEELARKPVSWFDAYFPDSANLAQPLFLGPLAGEETSVETEFHGPSGERMNLLIKSFPVIDDGGAVTLIGNFFVDVTEERRAQDELEASRGQFESFVRNAPAPMIVADMASGRVVMANEEVARCYGLTVAELLALTPDDMRAFWLDWERDFPPMFEEVLKTGVSRAIETRLRNAKTGEVRILLMSNFAIPAIDESRALLGSISTDITELREAESELRETKASLQAFFDNLPGLAFLSSRDGTIIAANSFLADHFGLERMRAENLIGKHGRALLPESWSANADRAIEANQTDGKPFVFENAIETPEGTRHVSAVRFPIRNSEGEIIHVGGLIFDRTAEKEATDAIVAARESLHQSEKLAALGQLLAGVSHELNNPLAAVIGQASLLAEDLDGTPHADRVGKIRRAADRCARIVQSFLALARQKPPEYRTVALDDLVRQAVELTEYQMRAANIEVFIGLDPGLPAIEADPDQLHQVLVNLLTNARQALEGIDGERRIGISAERAGKMVRMRVIDNGKGIPAEMRGRIFDPFFTTKAVGSGTGIGLSYSLGIVQAHGGTLELEDTESGTGFAITLPAAKRAAAGEAPDPVGAHPARGKALVIDDEADIADTLRDMLIRSGLDAGTAVGGKAGMAALEADADFDLILSDIRMPDMDGPALHGWIGRHRPELLGRLAFVTGDTLGAEVAAFLSGTDCPVLEKPFTAAALRELVERMLKP